MEGVEYVSVMNVKMNKGDNFNGRNEKRRNLTYRVTVRKGMQSLIMLRSSKTSQKALHYCSPNGGNLSIVRTVE